eukprot:gene35967-48384_t
MNTWKNIIQSSEEKRYLSQSRRRIEFVPSKSIKVPAIAFDLNSRNLSDKESSNNGKPKSIKSDAHTKSENNKSPQDNLDIGLFNPHIVTKYLTWKTVRKVGPGFFNDGNTCYLNSTLQCLLYLPTLTQILQLEELAAMKGLKSTTNAKNDPFNQGKKALFGNNNNNNNDHNKAVVAHFRHLVDSVWSVSHSKPLSPRGLISSIKRVGKQFKPFRQEDAHEYLRQLLDCMHEEVLKANRIRTSDGKVAETSFISRIFP